LLQADAAIAASADSWCDVSILGWMDANMCAPLGALLQRQIVAGKNITVNQVTPETEKILCKNEFLERFGRLSIADSHKTTIKYSEFRPEDKEAFQRYIASHFRSKSKGLPKMSDLLLRKFRESLFEIYGNAVEHSETQGGIFACGQFYPGRHRLDFSIADLGVGIRERIRRDLGLSMNPQEAVDWALKGNTTRTGKRPGGLGFSLIREFVQLNKGRIIVLSDAGYWEFAKGKTNVLSIQWPFPGTVVTIEINTADKASYRLKSEVNPNEIF